MRTIAPVAGDILEVAVHLGGAPSTAGGICGTFIVLHTFVGKWKYARLSLCGTIWVLCEQKKILLEVVIVKFHGCCRSQLQAKDGCRVGMWGEEEW